MKKLLLTALLSAGLAASFSASAFCTGTGSFRTCQDNNGNSYNIQQIGNTTYTNGRNSRTGSTWNQTSQTIGNTTYHNGTAASGNTWSGTSQRIGDTIYHNGINSNGNSYSGTSRDKNCAFGGC